MVSPPFHFTLMLLCLIAVGVSRAYVDTSAKIDYLKGSLVREEKEPAIIRGRVVIAPEPLPSSSENDPTEAREEDIEKPHHRRRRDVSEVDDDCIPDLCEEVIETLTEIIMNLNNKTDALNIEEIPDDVLLDELGMKPHKRDVVEDSEIRDAAVLTIEHDEMNGTTFTFKGKTLTFFKNKEVMWEQANELCPKLAPGSHLATVDSKTWVNFMDFVMNEYTNDICENCNLWIGGMYEGTKWIWNQNKELIPPKPTTDGYPPWGDLVPEFQEDCLSIRKNAGSSNIFFQGVPCIDTIGFICQGKGDPTTDISSKVEDEKAIFKRSGEEEIKEGEMNGGVSFEDQNNTLVFYTNNNVTWEDAKRLCPELVPGSQLATLDTKALADHVAYILDKYPGVDCNHCDLWVDGSFNGVRWVWERSQGWISPKEGLDGYPHWADELPSFNDNCLSVRDMVKGQEPHTLQFQGIECEAQLGFLCQIEHEQPIH